MLRRLGLADITIDYVVVDPCGSPRDLCRHLGAWRDGYADTIATNTSIARDEFLAQFDDMIATIHDPSGYGVWHVPVVPGVFLTCDRKRDEAPVAKASAAPAHRSAEGPGRANLAPSNTRIARARSGPRNGGGAAERRP
jgi:hypothetical protein